MTTGEDRFGSAFELVLGCYIADRTVQTPGIVMVHEIDHDVYSTLSRLILGVVIARPERPWQSPALERFEIAASTFGLLAMTPTNSSLTDH